MSLLKIRKYGDPVLRQKCKEVKSFTGEIKKLADDMLETMYQGNGVGLAAPQVGRQEQIIVVDVGQGPLMLANPRIVKESRQHVSNGEGCLSLPNIILIIKRARWVEVEAMRADSDQLIRIRAEGILAVALQHEIDHLEGRLIIDRVLFWQKWLAIRKLKSAGLV